MRCIASPESGSVPGLETRNDNGNLQNVFAYAKGKIRLGIEARSPMINKPCGGRSNNYAAVPGTLVGLTILIPRQHPPENLAHFGYPPGLRKHVVEAILAEI
jgi:hypothetical protein